MNNQEIADVLRARRAGLDQASFGSALTIPAYDQAINIIENLDKDYVKNLTRIFDYYLNNFYH